MDEETEDHWRARFEAEQRQAAEARAEAVRWARLASAAGLATWVLLAIAVVGWVVVVWLA